MDPRIDSLITNLRDTDAEIRRRALDELSKVEDRKHVIAAIHWTMLNDMEEEIRIHARKIYVKIGEQEKGTAAVQEPPKSVAPVPIKTVVQKPISQKTAVQKPVIQKTAVPQTIPVDREDRPHIKPILERDPNIPGSWSVHFALISIGLSILATLWHMPYGTEDVPFLDIIGYCGIAFTIPGLVLGIIGLRVKDLPTGSAMWGIILNSAILLIGVWNNFSRLFWK